MQLCWLMFFSVRGMTDAAPLLGLTAGAQPVAGRFLEARSSSRVFDCLPRLLQVLIVAAVLSPPCFSVGPVNAGRKSTRKRGPPRPRRRTD